MILPTLYKPTATGAIQFCKISTVKDVVEVEWGQLNGKSQFQHTVCTGKNLGRANETTPIQQAESEAQSKWNRKLKSGYSESISSAPSVAIPKKVKSWTQNHLPPKVTFPLISTPKLNGVNATFHRTNGTITITSRGGELYPSIPHLESDIHSIMDLTTSDELNGELYIHGESLQNITSAVKKPKPLSLSLEFAIFDLADKPTMKYIDRRAIMLDVESILLPVDSPIYFLTGVVCNSHAELESHYNQCMHQKLEGTVIKHPSALYEHNKRSNRMWKYKKTQSAEFQIQSFKLDKYGHPIYTCLTPSGATFSVKRNGTSAERLSDASVASENIGKWLTVEFETYSDSQIPLKGIGLDFRVCDSDGNPLE